MLKVLPVVCLNGQAMLLTILSTGDGSIVLCTVLCPSCMNMTLTLRTRLLQLVYRAWSTEHGPKATLALYQVV